jgi:hypothetical protein
VPKRTDLRTVLIVGSGPIRIGQGCEFDYAGAQACRVLRREGYRVVLVNSNPATIMTDPEWADATYLEPLDAETVAAGIERERPGTLLPALGPRCLARISRRDHRLHDALGGLAVRLEVIAHPAAHRVLQIRRVVVGHQRHVDDVSAVVEEPSSSLHAVGVDGPEQRGSAVRRAVDVGAVGDEEFHCLDASGT